MRFPNSFGFFSRRKNDQPAQAGPADQPVSLPEAEVASSADHPDELLLEQARDGARRILADEMWSRLLPPEMIGYLSELLIPQPSRAQFGQGVMAVMAVRELVLQSTLSESPALEEWFSSPSWPDSRQWLLAHLDDLPADASDRYEIAAKTIDRVGDDDTAIALRLHAALVREARRIGVDGAYRALTGNTAFPDQPPSHYDGNSSQRKVLTREEIEHLVADPEYLIQRFSLLPNDPRLPLIQKRLRGML